MPPSYTRTYNPEPGVVFVAMPYGTRELSPGGPTFNFDDFWGDVLKPTLEGLSLTPLRVDEVYGPTAVDELIFRSICRAEIVICDCTTRNPNVAYEFAMARMLNKRIIVLTQNEMDIPSDVRGQDRYIRYAETFKETMRAKHEIEQQIQALLDEPAEENTLAPLQGYSSKQAPGKVIAVDNEAATIRLDDGGVAELSNADVDYAKIITDMSRRFPVGTRVNGSATVDPEKGLKYTLLAGEENPWTKIARQFPVGRVFTSVVRNVIDGLGAFVKVEGPVNGLVPSGQLRGRQLQVGDSVDVEVFKVDTLQRRVTLELRSVSSATTAPASFTGSLPQVGWQGYGAISRVVPEQDGRGGYCLVKLDGFTRPAMLLAKDMTEDLRKDLNAPGELAEGDEVYVRVDRVVHETGKVLLLELPEPEEDGPAATAAA
ncbi:S1 RNA binding family protein [Motilibacter peucedani]|uniref:S1 RNA binding family protein n=2 Tax=Motilibacter peucedani TaxID=598650 RepID=A0A420XV67_9ACTN|nr:S1 RNA binding family protein [Motilibacter peucedani]